MASATSRGSTPNSHPQLLDRLAAWQQEFDAYYHWDRGWESASYDATDRPGYIRAHPDPARPAG